MKYILTFLLTIGPAIGDPSATHGMLIFGDKVTYASHLPMFHAPHDYQLILKLKFKFLPRSRTAIFYQEAKALGQKLFTIEPELMDLTQVMSGEKKNFSATLYSGHFERGGEALGTVIAEVEKIIYARKLAQQDLPPLKSYLVFGEEGEYFGVHLIGARPNYDLILEVGKIYAKQDCPFRACPDGGSINLPVKDADLPLILKSDSVHPKAGDALGFSFHTKVMEEIYFEKDELH